MGVLKRIKDDFTAAARRFAAVTAFAGSSLFFSTDGVAQTLTTPANNNAAQTEQVVRKHSHLNKKQRQEINAALIQQGQEQFVNFLPSVESGYSCQLQDLQQELNTRLKASDPNSKIRVVILDPIQMDVGLSLGLWPGEVAVQMLWAQGVKPDAILVYQVAEAFTGVAVVSAGQDTTYTSDPKTVWSSPDAEGNIVRIVIPVSDYAPCFYIPGLSSQDMTEAVDRHEGWHAIDRKNIRPVIDYLKLNPDSLKTIRQKNGNLDYLKYSCSKYNRESYADVGSAGDMIRNGRGPELISQLIAWRMANREDVSHMSPPALRELQAQISAMGLDKFRALDDQQAEQLYNGVIDKIGLTPARLTLVYQYLQCAPEKRMDFVVENECDPDFAVAFSYINSFVMLDVAERPVSALSEDTEVSMILDMMDIPAAMQAWDAKTDLQKRAMAIDGKITPASYARAYGSLMNDMDNLFDSADIYTQAFLASKMIKLKNTFLVSVVTTDYVQANKIYGVDIVVAEPSLQKALQQDKQPKSFFPHPQK
ncbi:MAG: hypothetical protein K8R48_01455 [Alphaproteobacteria bacterium]|nr:hypothetical protein [Alphaproteobacteria bacterium]